ncbi:MAG TPA: nuclear transport factor 2 family protein [Usitatibacteraceae bacterium]|jgi:ketosteroid isomerase-like protein|nr:nuclear transport factor 2 family protein [Usitatibacteraceae bacterium]
MPPRTRKLFPTPDDAETAFYDAFERGDLAAMMVVWAEGEEVVCVHPSGPRLVGFEAVRESWMQIFAGGTKLSVRIAEGRRLDGPSVSVRSVVELVSVPGREGPAQRVSATNVYVLTDAGWRIAMHHASPPEEPEGAEVEEIEEPHTLH